MLSSEKGTFKYEERRSSRRSCAVARELASTIYERSDIDVAISDWWYSYLIEAAIIIYCARSGELLYVSFL